MNTTRFHEEVAEGEHGLPTLHVTFRGGAEVLRQYWGHLSHGGLYLPEAYYCAPHNRIALIVEVLELQGRYRMKGEVLGMTAENEAIFAFASDGDQARLVADAWSAVYRLPKRASPRRSIHGVLPVDCLNDDGERVWGRVLDVSKTGTCLSLGIFAQRFVSVGARMTVAGLGGHATGVIRWLTGPEVGLEFELQRDAHAPAAFVAAVLREEALCAR